MYSDNTNNIFGSGAQTRKVRRVGYFIKYLCTDSPLTNSIYSLNFHRLQEKVTLPLIHRTFHEVYVFNFDPIHPALIHLPNIIIFTEMYET